MYFMKLNLKLFSDFIIQLPESDDESERVATWVLQSLCYLVRMYFDIYDMTFWNLPVRPYSLWEGKMVKLKKMMIFTGKYLTN